MHRRAEVLQALDHAIMLPHEKSKLVSYVDTLEKMLKYVIDATVSTSYHDLGGYGVSEESYKEIQLFCEQIPYPHGWEP